MTIRKFAADEILENMAKDMGFKSEASVAEEFKSALKDAKTESAVDAAWNNYKSKLRREVAQQDWEAMYNAKKGQIKKEKSVNTADDAELDHLAINQAIDHLISAADLLDASGFEKHAAFVDRLLKVLVD